MIEQGLFKRYFVGRDGFVWWIGQIPNEDVWKETRPFPKAVGMAPDTNPHAGVWPPVVTNVTQWQGHAVIACGEVRPRVRSRRVFMIKP